MKRLFIFLAVCLMACPMTAIAQHPAVDVAQKFCTAVYNNDMVTAKSYMTPESARLTPDKMSFDATKGRQYLQRLQNSEYKVIPNEYTSSIVTVRFYDPQYEYLAKAGRWFCCAISLVEVRDGFWLVTDYGY